MENSSIKPKKNGLGLAGMIISIIGFIFSVIPLVNLFGIWIAALGGIFSLIGAFKQPRTMAIVGLVLSILSAVVFFWMYSL